MAAPRFDLGSENARAVGARSLARGVTATWWYTASGVLFVGLVSQLQWLVWVLNHEGDVGWRLSLAVGAGALSLVGAAVLLHDYRPSVMGDDPQRMRRADVAGLGAMAVGAALFGVATGSWMAGISIVAFALSMRPWMHGIRWRVVLGLVGVLVALWIAEAGVWATPATDPSAYTVPALLSVLLPLISGSSLWWWDIVLELDRARQAESLLAATRERLRLANDVHDLQGHHLQVIALQLELAQRLMDRDPEGAAREIARARAAVDDARQGTRDLAARFRGVPLPDELQNAADLLRSAGLEVEARVGADVVDAPGEVLGPIVRESVTNVLKHGEGTWAKLSLEREGDSWVYRIANDDDAHHDTGEGAGLAGMWERAEALGGEVGVHRDGGVFTLTVSLPSVVAGHAEAGTEGRG